MLTGVTAAHLLAAVGAKTGETVLLHGAGGGVGQMVIQLAAARGVRVIGTASTSRHDELRALAPDTVVPVAYGDGLLDRVRAAAPDGVDAAVDAIGTDEAVDTSLALLADRERFASIAAFGRAGDGIRLLGGGPGADPGTELRRAARAELIALVEGGRLTVTVDRTYPLAEVRAAHTYLQSGHARGKIALIP
jgi:NADPH:quinone reductase-like Zn-dependent oxidoreductase